MIPFYLKSITIDEKCDVNLMKTLHPGIYKLSEDLPLDLYGKNISICAIVGENGAGKSSLLDMLYRIINNLSYLVVGNSMNRSASAPLYYIKGLYSSVEYVINGKDYRIICRGDFVGMCSSEESWYTSETYGEEVYFDSLGCVYKEQINDEDRKEILENCFFTIATNYSLQAFNSNDYRQDKSIRYVPNLSRYESDGIWLDSIFNKNDGYLVPLNACPYRSQGVFDLDGESERVEDRLTSLLTQFKQESKELLPNYEVDAITYSFDDYALVRKFWRHKPPFNNGPEIQWPLDLYNRAKKAVSGKVDTYLKVILQAYDVIYANDKSMWDAACIYLGYKTLTIAHNYPSYQQYAHLGNLWNIFEQVDSKKKQQLEDLVHQILQDPSHITVKIDQTRLFLQTYSKKNKLLFKRGFTLNQYINIINGRPFHTGVDGFIGMLPPPIFVNRTTLMSTQKMPGVVNKPIPYVQLSSGERQFLSIMSTLVYHVKNLMSVTNDRVRYRNINIVLDEVEICFHPEYQRLLVERLVAVIEQLELNRECAFNIILTTHSPFILSDIAPNNILYLKEGKTFAMKGDILRPFAANINDIMQKGFFLEKGFVGEHAKNQILSLVKFLKGKKKKDGIWNATSVSEFIAMIGEPMLHDALIELQKKHEAHRNK